MLLPMLRTIQSALGTATHRTRRRGQPVLEPMEDRNLLSLVMINDPRIIEGTGGTKSAQFTVSLSGASTQPITVDYQTVDYTAKAGSDYERTSGTLSFTPGQTTKTVSVVVTGDSLVELTEAFGLSLSRITNATAIDTLGICTIQDDDTVVAPELSIDDPRISEGNSGTKLLSFTVSLNRAVTDRDVVVTASTRNSTALAGSDYVARTETLTFKPGETLKRFSVVIQGDTQVESSEAFFVSLTGANLAVKKANGVGFILNDDLLT